MKTFETLSDALGIEHKPEQEVLPPVKLQQSEEKIDETVETVDQREDYELSRKTFRELIKKGNDAIEGITDLAKQSESPRAYEVLATLMKTVADTTDQLFTLQKKMNELNKKDKSNLHDDQKINVERAVFVGSTAELLKKVKNNEEL